jgi:hypothetical protein
MLRELSKAYLETETKVEIGVEGVKKIEDCRKDARVDRDTDVNEVAPDAVLTLRDRLRSWNPVAAVSAERLGA